ncbi:DNA polymerase III subunit gamma/tau [Legionella nagasakiensis]|uniref:DNA polymerase III subunit gamma/tau n=1 Tax=Legionella nagasakiensis TaxID=535290 RepID=UPI0010557A1B|nr:DNA polymerase III subunit gamma/tau [Legionella nagasakiensis]
MSYIALARKWRPRTFSQLVGQEHVTKALTNSLNQQRMHHAYLFTGTRGVGKTSVARLLAKALNCEQGISAEPCLQCDACIAIEQGRFLDLIEIDGASRTRVEDTREILENVQYAPTNGRFKIYLIDEVHMLSQHSFNALLKTLEEPPTHVKFLLATTDSHKLPITVLSRCLQFNLKPLPSEIICQQLQYILNNEHVTFDEQALELLAAAASGSMRDALSLLDQAIAYSDNHVTTLAIKNILGYTQQNYAIQLLNALADSDPKALIHLSKQIMAEGGNFHYVLDEILNHLHQICVTQNLPNNNPLLCPNSDIISLSQKFTAEDIQLFYQIGIKGLEELHLAPSLIIGFEMTLLRMYTFKPAPEVATPPLAYQNNRSNRLIDITHPSVSTSNPHIPNHSEKKLESATEASPPSFADIPDQSTSSITKSPPIEKNNKSVNGEGWHNLLPKLKLSGLALSAAENTEWVGKNEGEVTLRIASSHQSVFTTAVIDRIEKALADYYQETVKLILQADQALHSSPAQQKKTRQEKQHQEAEIALQTDPLFQQIQQEFSATLVKNSIVPRQDDL